MQIPYLVGCLRDAGLPPYQQNWVLAMLWAPQRVKPSFTPLLCPVAHGIHEMMLVHMQWTCYTWIIEYTCPTQQTKTQNLLQCHEEYIDLGRYNTWHTYFTVSQSSPYLGQSDFQRARICLFKLCFAFFEFSHPVFTAPSLPHTEFQLACPVPLTKAFQSLLQSLLLIIQHLALCCFW